MTSIYNLSWSEVSFFAKLRLFFESRVREKQKMMSDNRQIQAQGYSALSSTYYSIVGTAVSHLKAALKPRWLIPVRVAGWCLTWLPLAAWCYWRMLPLSNRSLALIGYDGMSADRCDARQSVLRKRGEYEEAKMCIHAALFKYPEKAHTRGLLHVGLAEIYLHEGDWRAAGRELKLALVLAEEAEEQDSRQAARIYRHCAGITDFLDTSDFVEQGDRIPSSQLRLKAEALARASGAKDQLLKL